MGKAGFFDILKIQCETKRSQLCVGLDPRIKIENTIESTAMRVIEDCHRIINSTIDVACCYKPNIAFFEALGPPGLVALKSIISYIHELKSLVILDCKRGDIGSTAVAYAKMCYDFLDADCVTLSPFLGYDSIGPFINEKYIGKGVFILCCTSNPSHADIQDDRIYQKIAELCCNDGKWGKQSHQNSLPLGLVIGATKPEVIEVVRKKNTDSWFLTPGVGAQGGDIEKLFHSVIDYPETLDKIIVPISRGISQADDIRYVAEMYKNKINQVISETKTLFSMP